MKQQIGLVLALMLVLVVASLATAQDAVVAPPENIVATGVPAIPVALAETAGRYKESRAAFAPSWHPQRHELLISTRFANTYQTHLVKMPGGSRQQLTFFRNRFTAARSIPLAATTSFFKRMSAAANGTKFFATTSPPATAHFLPTGNLETFKGRGLPAARLLLTPRPGARGRIPTSGL